MAAYQSLGALVAPARKYCELGRHIPDESGRAPNIGIIPLVPVDKSLLHGDAQNSRPATAETNIMLAIEEVGGIARVQVHRLESIVWRQRCASPFPKTTKITLSAEAVAVARDRRGMPVAESYIAIGKLDEELVRVWLRWVCTAVNGAIRKMA